MGTRPFETWDIVGLEKDLKFSKRQKVASWVEEMNKNGINLSIKVRREENVYNTSKNECYS